jgi:hypothetical protein
MKYVPKLQLWPHQEEAVKKMRGKEAFALLLAMRTGKTAVQLADFGQLELDGKAKDLCIIAPAGVYRTWQTAIEEHASDDLQSRLQVHTWTSGKTKRQERERATFLEAKEPRTLLMNVEALSRPGDAREFIQEFLDQRDNVTALDESTIAKNPSKRTKFIIDRVRPLTTYRRILSGLPTPRDPMDLFFQFYFLDYKILGHKSWYTFRADIAFLKDQWFGGRRVTLIDKEQGDNGFNPAAVKRLQQLILPHSHRVEFRPKVPSTYSIREVEMTDEQIKAYAEMKEFATTTLKNEANVTATVVIAQIMRLHQILCGHVKDEEGNEHELPENRTKALLELLDDYSGKAIIWCSYDYDIRKVAFALAEEYGDPAVARFWGGNTKNRDADVIRFKTDPNCRFIVATPDSGGRGQTWDVADLTVYYSSKDNLEHREQSEQRSMGRNKEKGVDNVDLVCPDTIEWRQDGGPSILMALRKKINMSTAINGDNYKQWLI